MQVVNPANIVTMNCNRKWKSRGKWIVCTTNFQAGRDNWIGEAIVAQANHEAMRYTHYRNSISALPCNENLGPIKKWSKWTTTFGHPNLVWEDQIWLPKLVYMAQPKMVRSGKLIEFMRTWSK